jgi:hypothetical protein
MEYGVRMGEEYLWLRTESSDSFASKIIRFRVR